MSNLPSPVDQLFSQAVGHHIAGRFPQAEALYRQVLAANPNHHRALHYLGVLAVHFQKPDMAIPLIRQAIAIAPNYAEGYLDLGNALQAKGQIPQAVDAFRRAAELKPNYAGPYINLGHALELIGKHEEARSACKRAIAIDPNVPQAYNNLGNALLSLKRLDEAAAAYQKAISLSPNFALAYHNLGNVQLEKKQPQEAARSYEKAIALDRSLGDSYAILGRIYLTNGRVDDAIAISRQAVALKPQSFEAHLNLGDSLQQRGVLFEAVAEYQKAIAIRPDDATTYNQLANTFKALQRIPEAIAAYEKCISLNPKDPLGHNNLGALYGDTSQSDKAIACYRRAIELDPGYLGAVVNLGNAWKDQGRLDECVDQFQKGIALDPASALVQSKLVYTLHFHPDYDAPKIGAEARLWNHRHAAPLKSEIPPHTNSRKPDRRLKVGYVSPDFWGQAESYFVVPLLESHDHEQFEIHCYASVAHADPITARQKKTADVWHDVYGLPDTQVAEAIRRDGIDILVDLTMHMANNRLLVFARKPAPVQVTWLAYPGTTGLEAIDYRITDRFMDPPDADVSCYSEKSVRLPDCWVCFDPLIDTPPAVPRGPSDPIVFGSLNNPCKINRGVLELWAQVVKNVPASKLLLLIAAEPQRADILEFLEARQVDRSRVEFVSYTPRPEYLRYYDRIDICLDPLPYNGITTTCDALWMGVPVVSLAGNTASGRAGLGMLTTIGMPDLATHTEADFLKTATALAHDRPRLAELRKSLRHAIESSALMDHRRYTRDLEAAYRQMWRTWCATG